MTEFASTEAQQDDGPWRIGSHYGIHVYKGGDPVATFLRPENAAEAVAAVNAQHAARPSADTETLRAEAWDEGYRAGRSRAMRRMSDEPGVADAANPYRAALDGDR